MDQPMGMRGRQVMVPKELLDENARLQISVQELHTLLQYHFGMYADGAMLRKLAEASFVFKPSKGLIEMTGQMFSSLYALYVPRPYDADVG